MTEYTDDTIAQSKPTDSLGEIFTSILADSVDKREQGTRFERAVEWFLKNDPAWVERLTGVWLWDEAPTNPGKQDTGIDLVAKDVDGTYWAIQAKCYSKARLANGDVATFFMNALADDQYQHYMIADTAPGYTSNLETYFNTHPDLDLVRMDLETMRDANLDWSAFVHGTKFKQRATYDSRPHQREAIDAVKQELSKADRCSMVMACGTGKTLTSLRLTEEMLGEGGTVLFLAPSISLVSQTMRDWVNQVRVPINVYVVCSDGKASKLSEESYGQLSDIPFPATTNPVTVSQRFHVNEKALNVVFSTYQSIQVIHDAQEKGLPDFDLTICDEAHRTTGVIDGEAAFRKIHDSHFIRSNKRLYMTATPRIFSEGARNKADAGAIQIASMDDTHIFGKIAYRLSFGKAVDQHLLTDYKIVVMQVAESMMGKRMQEMYGAKDSEIPLDDAAKFVGCWKALFDRKRSHSISDIDIADSSPTAIEDDSSQTILHHAIAFAPSIKASKALTERFRAVIDDYTSNLEDSSENKALIDANKEVLVDIQHVDGGMDSQTRKTRLDWLAASTADNECHILSNARCLAEGIDVPDLDAVMYLSSRKSKIDIIQSVGRVMRRSPGKKYGYIIIPVVIPLGADADSVLSSGAYKPVWDVVTALRSHDERLDAVINSASLGDTDALSRIIEVDVLDESKLRKNKRRNGQPANRTNQIGSQESDDRKITDENIQEENSSQPELDFDLSEMARGINAQIVRKCGTKIYWGEWTDDIASITRSRIDKITELVSKEGPARSAFLTFLQGLQDSLNPGYSEADAIAVLAQHEITKPIFETLFTNKEVLANNPIIKGLDRALNALYAAGLPDSIDSVTLRDLYASVRLSAAQLQSDLAKQNLIKEIYNDFFTKAFKDTADSLGIVYTPVEVVDAQLHMVERALQREFNQSLSDKGVHILDGFAGTGTYICRLIEDRSLISDEDLPYKYNHDLHSNEIVPLAETIMDINIEQSYHKRVGGDYQPFPGALLTDTFQMYTQDDPLDLGVFVENTARVKEQKDLPIKIIIGNPPYRAGDSQNTGNQNTRYPELDKRVEETYVANSDATLNNSLYDHYIRAFRWASDRIGSSGIVCFVSNGGWLTSAAGAGVRRCFTEEFNDIYVYNLRGNARTQGEERRKEKDNVFGSGTKTTIVITTLVKNPESAQHGVIHYHDIGDYLSQKDKLGLLTQAVTKDPEWTSLEQDKHGDWLNHRDDSYKSFIPAGIQVGTRKLKTGLFSIWSAGVKTNRDSWCYNSERNIVIKNMKRTVDTYNSELLRWQQADKPANVQSFLTRDQTRIKWTHEVYSDIVQNRKAEFNIEHVRLALYRPFFKQWQYIDPQFNNRVYLQPQIFPASDVENLAIITGERGPFITNLVPDLELNHHGQCFPLYWYEQISGAQQGQLAINRDPISGETPRWVQHSAITDTTLRVFREAYQSIHLSHHVHGKNTTLKASRDPRISKEDIFFYVYGILHSPEYRQRFGNNLKKELPRIPLANDFVAFMNAGRALADLHLNYETVENWPLIEVGNSKEPGRTEKMKYPQRIKDPETGKRVPDRTVLQVAEHLTLHGIPLRAYEYVVNGKSAIGWLIDRYKVTTDNKSGITNDPNNYSDNPRYIVELVEKVVTVSMKTLDIVESLPPLEELPQPTDWPADWRI